MSDSTPAVHTICTHILDLEWQNKEQLDPKEYI